MLLLALSPIEPARNQSSLFWCRECGGGPSAGRSMERVSFVAHLSSGTRCVWRPSLVPTHRDGVFLTHGDKFIDEGIFPSLVHWC